MGVVAGVNMVPGVLAKDQQFIEVLLGCLRADGSCFAGDFHHRDVAIVDESRHARHTVGIGSVVPSACIAAQPSGLVRLPTLQRTVFASSLMEHRPHRRVNVARAQQGETSFGIGEVLRVNGCKGHIAQVGFHGEVQFGPRALQARLSQFLGGVTELERAVHRFAKQRHGNDAVTVHFHRRAVG